MGRFTHVHIYTNAGVTYIYQLNVLLCCVCVLYLQIPPSIWLLLLLRRFLIGAQKRAENQEHEELRKGSRGVVSWTRLTRRLRVE